MKPAIFRNLNGLLQGTELSEETLETIIKKTAKNPDQLGFVNFNLVQGESGNFSRTETKEAK